MKRNSKLNMVHASSVILVVLCIVGVVFTSSFSLQAEAQTSLTSVLLSADQDSGVSNSDGITNFSLARDDADVEGFVFDFEVTGLFAASPLGFLFRPHLYIRETSDGPPLVDVAGEVLNALLGVVPVPVTDSDRAALEFLSEDGEYILEAHRVNQITNMIEFDSVTSTLTIDTTPPTPFLHQITHSDGFTRTMYFTAEDANGIDKYEVLPNHNAACTFEGTFTPEGSLLPPSTPIPFDSYEDNSPFIVERGTVPCFRVTDVAGNVTYAHSVTAVNADPPTFTTQPSWQSNQDLFPGDVYEIDLEEDRAGVDIDDIFVFPVATGYRDRTLGILYAIAATTDGSDPPSDCTDSAYTYDIDPNNTQLAYADFAIEGKVRICAQATDGIGRVVHSDSTPILTLAFTPFISINVAPTDRNATRERTVTATVADADAVSDFEVATDVTKANCSASGTLNVTFNTYTNGEDHTVAANRHDCFRVTETATSTVFYASTESAMVPFSPVLRFDYDTEVGGDGVSSNSTDPWRFLLCGVPYRAINNAGAVEYTNSAGTTNMQVLTGFSPRSPECGTDINFARHLFALPIPSMGEGRYALRARHVNVNDNEWSPITYVTYDVTPPDITVTTSTDTVTNAKVAYATAVEAHGIARFDVFSNIASANCNGAGVSGRTPITYISGTSSDILGIHDCFRAIDVAGNVGYATTENALEIPPAPTGISLHANSDSGIQDDDITNTPANQQFTFLVAGEFSTGDRINLQIEDSTGTAISGTFFKEVATGENSSVPVPVVAGTFTSNGVYTVTATRTNKAFETSAVSPPYTFTIERTAPTITIEDPDDRPLAEERTYTVTTADTGGSGVDKVEYLDSHTGVCDTTTTGSWAEVSGNTHTVAASTITCFRVTDVAGNTEFAVTPTVFTIALIPEHDSGILGNGITNWDSSNDFTFEVTGNFVVGSTFGFRDSTDNTIGVKTVVDGEETSFQISVNGVFFRSNGIHNFSAGFGEPYQAGTLTIDRIPPQLTVENSSGNPNFADRTFTISVSDTSSITVGYVDNVSSCDGDSGVFTDLPLVARSATRVVEANEVDCFRATDAAGNITYQSTPETVVPEFTTHPSWNESATVFSAGGLEIDRGENRNGVTIASIFNAAVATDNSGVPTIAYAAATADIDGSGPIDDCSDTATYSYSLGATLAYDEIDSHGKVRVCARATDDAGNIAYSNATAVLTFDITPPAPTELQLVESQDTGQDSTDGITSFSSARSEGGRNYLDFEIQGDFVAGDEVQLFFTDESATTRNVVSTVVTTGNTFTVGVDITDPVFTTGDGAYEVEATVEDSSASPSFTLLLDTTAPSVSVVNVTGGTSDVSRNHIVTIEDANTLIFSGVADSVAVCTAVGTAGVTFEDFTSGEEHFVEADTQDCFRAIDIAGNATYVSTADAMVLAGPVIVSLLANLGGTAPPASTYDTGLLNTDGITNFSTLTESVSLPGKYQFFVSAYPSLTPGSPEFPSEVATIDYEITSPDNTTVLIEGIGRSEFLTFREDGTDVQRDRDISFFDADGSYQLRARYEAGDGAYSLWSPVRTLVVDRTGPNLFVEGVRGITVAEERTLTIVATDTNGIDKVEYLDNASSCDANTSGNFTSISLTTEGTATRVVEANEQDCFKATDVAGNVTYTNTVDITYAGPVIVSLLANLDETAPPASTYDTGILNTDGITNLSTLTESVSLPGKYQFFVSAYPSLTPGSPEFPTRAITIDYEIASPDNTTVLIEDIGRSEFLTFREDGTDVQRDRDIAFFDADGSYQLRARYEDVDGTYSRWSPVRTLVVDRTDPTLLVEGVSGVVVTEERIITISASDANGIEKVEWLDNVSSCDVNTVGIFTPVTFTSAGTATHVIEANTQDCFKMTDIAGNIAYKNTADAVLDTTDPVITIGGFNNDAGLSDEVGFTKGKYSVTVTDQTAVTVEYLDNATSCDADTTGSFQPFSGTEHVIELSTQTCFKATDSAGNVGYAITPVPPVATLIAAHDTGFASDDGITNRSPTLSYTLEITGSFAVNDQIRFYAPGGLSRGTKTIVAGEESGFQHTFNFPASDATFEGEVVLRANLPHIAILLTFTIDRTNPTLTVVDDSGDPVTEERTFTITASDAGGLEKVEHFDNVSSCNASTTGTPTTLTLTNGSTTQVVQANEMDCFKATDLAGNVTYAGTPASDNAPPSIVGVPTLVTNNTNTAIAKEGETITLTFTVSETLESDPEVTIAGDLADVTLGASNTYTAVITVDGSTIEGAVTYAIGTLTDLGNNTHNPNPVTTEGATLVTVDTTDPLIDGTPTLTSDNTNTSLAILDDVLTLSFNTTEVLASAPTVTIAGQTVTATGVGTSYTAVITVSSSNQEGAAIYDIGTLTDAAGNTSNPDSVTTAVVVDTSIPTLVGNPTLVTNNTNTKVAKTGETITLTFTVSETLASAPSVAIAGQTVTATGAGNTYTAVITVGSSTTEGAVTYDIGTLTDVVGNTFNPEPVTLAGVDEVVVDTINPTITLTDPQSRPVTADRTFTIATVDATTVTVEFLNNHTGVCDNTTSGSWATVSGSTHTVDANTQTCFRATDAVGNQGFALTGALDTTNPVITSNPQWSTNTTIFPSDVYEIDYTDHLTNPAIGSIFTPATATDNIGVPTITYAVATSTLNGTDPSATCSDLSTYSYNLTAITYNTIALHGKVRVCAKVTDGANNTAYSSPTPVLTVNLTPPAPTNVTLLEAHNSGSTADTITNRAANQPFTFTITGTFAEDDTVSLHVENSTGTAVSNSPFVETVGSSETGSIDIDVPANTLTADGEYTITATHTAYNQTSAATSDYTITVDRTNPTLTIADSQSRPVTADRTFTITAADTNGSGIDKTEYINNHTGVCDATVTSGWATVSGSTHAVAANTQTCFRATDVAGNQVFANTDAPDTTDPVITTNPLWSTNSTIFPGDVYEIDYADHLTNPTIGSIFTPATATDNIGVPTITYAVATSTLNGTDPSATCSDLSTYSYNLSTIIYDTIATHGKVRVCASATDGGGNIAYSSPTPVLTVDFTPPAPTNVTLLEAHNSGSTADTITNRAANQPFTFTVTGTFAENDTVSLHVADSTSTPVSNSPFVKIVGSSETGSIDIDVPANTLTADGDYTITATYTANTFISAATSDYTITIDRTIPAFTTNPAWNANAPQFSGGFSIDAAEDTAGPSMSDLFTQAVAEAGATLAYAKVTNSDFSTPPTDCTSAAFSYTLGNTLEYTDIDDQGTTQVCARATDAAGNQAFFRVVEVLTFDTTVPGAPTNLALATADDTGDNSDRITSQFTDLTITGNNTAGSTVQVSTSSAFTSPFTVDTNSSATAFAIDITLPNNTTSTGVTHTIYVRELDANGNPSPTATLRITIDTTDPTIVGSPTLVTNNSDTTVAREGNTITLTFTVSETLASAPSVAIAGQTITATGVGNTYTAVITVNSSTTEGAVTYDINTLTDVAGNTSNPDPVTLAGAAEVVVDTTDPTIVGSPTLVTNNSDTTVAREGNTITLTFTVSETLASAPSVAIAGQTITATGVGNTYTAVITVNSSTTEGAVTYDINTLTDVAGNTSNPDPVTLAGAAEVVVDTTDPTIVGSPTLVTNNSDTTVAREGNTITLTFTVSETLASAPSVAIAGQTITATGVGNTYTAVITVNSSTTEGAVTYDINTLTDVAGNTSNPDPVTLAGAAEVVVDTINPTITLTDPNSRPVTADRTFTIATVDATTVTVEFLNNHTGACNTTTSGSWATVSGSTHTVAANTRTCFRATDAAGNQAFAFTDAPDTTNPVITASPLWRTNGTIFPSNVYTIDYTDHLTNPTIGSIFIPATATDNVGVPTITYAVARTTNGSNPSGTCSDTNTYSYNLSTITYSSIAIHGKVRVCARATDGVNRTVYSNPTPVLTVNLTPPAPANVTLLSAHNSGSTADTITNRAANQPFTFTVTGTFTTGNTVSLNVADSTGSAVGSSPFTKIVGSSETSSINVDVSPNTFTTNGIYTITATQTAAGRTSATTSNYTITIDRTIPAFTTNPAWNANAPQFSGGFSINAAEDTAGPSMNDLFTQAVVEAGATLAYAKVTNSDFSTPPTDCTSAAFSYTLGSTLAYNDIDDQGTTQVCARATDVAGNQAFFRVVEVLTFNTSVSGAITNLALAAADDTGDNSDRITSQFANLTITGNNTAGSTVQVSTSSDFASPVTTDTNSSATAFAIDITLPDNTTSTGVTHTIYVRELDANSNPSPTATLRITIDTTNATIVGNPTLVTNNSDTAVAREGNTITLTFTVSETLANTPTVTIAGDSASVTPGVGTSYSAVITVDSGTDAGAVTYDIGTLTDLAGNTANPAPVTSTVTVTRSSSGGGGGSSGGGGGGSSGGGGSPGVPSNPSDGVTAPTLGTRDGVHGFVIGDYVPEVAPTVGRSGLLTRAELIVLLRQRLYEILQKIRALLQERLAARQATSAAPLQELPPREILFNKPLPSQPTGPVNPFGRPSVGLPKEETDTVVPSEGPSFGR